MKYADAGAIISADQRHRYLLWREWRGTHDPKNWNWFGAVDGAGEPLGEPKPVLFVMLNPSTADGASDDPTVRRCVSFAASWKFERLEIVNLFAYRTSEPAALLALTDRDDPIGRDNMMHVQRAASRADLIVCAWGDGGSDYLGQAETIRGWIGDRPVYALGLTRKGNPRHPLYLVRSTPLVEMSR